MKRIKIQDCSIRIAYIAEPLGFKTLLSFRKFIMHCNPKAKLYYNGSYVMAEQVLKLIDREYVQRD